MFALMFALTTQAGQEAPAVRQAIDDFLVMQTQGLPGKASYTIGRIANTERLPSCNNLRVALPQGGKLWGRSNVVVRCEAPQNWSLYVPIKVKVVGNYLVSARALRQGQRVTPEDIGVQQGDLAELPNGTLTEAQQAVGKTMAVSMGPGQPLRGDGLRQPFVVQQNQTVKVVSRGEGFAVASEGIALNNGAAGQVVRVRLGSGQLVSGVADDGGNVVVAY